jgi:hypothetical protein
MKTSLIILALAAFSATTTAVAQNSVQLGGSPEAVREMIGSMPAHIRPKEVSPILYTLGNGSAPGATRVEVRSSEQVTISGIVAVVPTRDARSLEVIARRIDQFNMSAPLGTMQLDRETGVITLQHHLNPTKVTPAAMADVLLRFTRILGAQSGAFGGVLA